ncbi:MAG TPA: hypothetical protein VIG46_05600 [Candidatus Baltobacteraceae bacterium]|jgi:lipoprotein-anchoring transpeptidase ErfK/SrfK
MDVQALVGTTGAGTAAGAAAPGVTQPTPPAASDTSHVMGAVPKRVPGGIAAAIAKIYGGGDSGGNLSQPAVNVSYKIEGKTIHTVFTDPTTGQEIAQFPPDLLQHIAAFFDAEQGVTLDKEA